MMPFGLQEEEMIVDTAYRDGGVDLEKEQS
jgi:hypothetical protein